MNKSFRKTAAESLAVLLSLIILIPFFLILVNSLKGYSDAIKLDLSFRGVSWKQIVENYTYVFKEGGMLTAYKNSLFITAVSVILVIVSSSMAAFIIQRRKQRLTAFINYIIVTGMTLSTSIVCVMFILKSIGLSQSFAGLFLVYMAGCFPMGVFLYTGYLKSISIVLDESAIIDGCNTFMLFFKVIFPLLKPITVTFAIIVIMTIWNDFVTPLYLIGSPKRFTVVLTMYFFYGQKHSDWHLLFADIVLISAPVVIMYFVLQKYIVAGITAGAVKG